MKQLYGQIKPITGGYIAGIYTIKILPVEWLVTKWKPSFKHGVVPDIFIEEGRDLLSIDLIQNTYKYTEKPKQANSGTYYDISLTGTSNDIDQDTMQILNTYRYHQWLVLLTDTNKRIKIIGNKDAGLIFSFDNDEDTDKREQQVKIGFTMQSEYPALFFGKEIEDIVIVPKLAIPGNGFFYARVNDAEDGLLVLWRADVPVYPPGVSFIFERSTTADFSDNVQTPSFDHSTGSYNDTDIIPNTTYYYRMKATASGYQDSDWATTFFLLPAAASLPNNDLWLDLFSEELVDYANNGTYDLVSKWTDRVSGKEYSDSGYRPCLYNDPVLGKPVISSHNNTSNAVLQNLNLSQALPDNAVVGLTIYVVGCQNSTDDIYGTFISFGNNVSLRRYYNTNRVAIKTRPSNNFYTTAEAADDSYKTFRLRFDGTNQSLSINNGTEQIQPVIDSFWYDGISQLFSQPSNKKIARILVYRRNHSPEEIDQVENYLRDYYGHY